MKFYHGGVGSDILSYFDKCFCILIIVKQFGQREKKLRKSPIKILESEVKNVDTVQSGNLKAYLFLSVAQLDFFGKSQPFPMELR